jgi:hypothetical protein
MLSFYVASRMWNPSALDPAVYFHLLIYGVLKDALSIANYTALGDRIIREYWTERMWKEATLF